MPAPVVVHPPVVAEVSKLDARGPPRILRAVDVHRGNPDPQILRELGEVQPKAVALVRHLLGVVEQVRRVVPQPYPQLDLARVGRQVVQRRRLRLHDLAAELVDVVRFPRDRQAEILQYWERQAPADEHRPTKRQRLVRGFLGVIEQIAPDQKTALRKAADSVVGTMFSNVVL